MSEIYPKRISGQDSADAIGAGVPSFGGAGDCAPGFAKEFEGALSNLSELDSSGKLREDSIQNAKAIIKNWKPPTDQQIERILFKMRNELLA